MPVSNATDPLSPDDIAAAGMLANAAYGENAAGAPVSAVDSLVGSGWSYVNPGDLGIAAQYVDAQGFLNVQETDPDNGITIDAQVLLARRDGVLAIVFRGTSSATDLINDILGAVGGFGLIYNHIDPLVSTILGNAGAFGATRILVAGHSLGGAMAEEMMARHPADGRLVGVTFGSPGINDDDVADAPGSDIRLLNVGHGRLEVPFFVNPLTVLGDAIFRQTPFEHVQGSDVRVFLPDEGEMTLIELAASYLAGNGTGQHVSPLYVETAADMAREAALMQALGLPASVRDFGFLRGTAPGGSVLVASGGLNVLMGGAAGDRLAGLGGSDIVDGAGGIDMAEYALDAGEGGAAAVYVDLGGGIAVDGFGDVDKLVDVENVRGSNAAMSAAGSWADILVGSNGDNLFVGLAGDDMIDGLGGADTVSYADDAQFGGGAGVTVDLEAGLAFDGFGDTDLLISIENVVGTDGSLAGFPGFSDSILGDAGDNRLDGRGGRDFLVGRGGNDRLIGGAGDDLLDGGEGDDTLDGGPGTDRLKGGAGGDTFVVRLSDAAHVLIEDFDLSADFLMVDINVRLAIQTLLASYLAFQHVFGGAETPVAGGFRLTMPGLDVTIMGVASVGDLAPRVIQLA